MSISYTNNPIIEYQRSYCVTVPLGGYDTKYSIYPGIVPDELQVTCSIGVDDYTPGADKAYAVGPIYSGSSATGTFYPGTGSVVLPFLSSQNIFTFESDLVQDSLIGVCNGENSFNPKLVFPNTSKSPMSGTFSLRVRNTADNSPVVVGNAVLLFTFVKYKKL